MVSRFFKKLRDLFSSEVSNEIAACEFDCRKLKCSNDDFVTCPKRLQKVEDLKKLSQKNLALNNTKTN